MLIAAVTFTFTSSPIFWIIAVALGLASMAQAQRFKSQAGRNPWGIPPILWLVIGFALGLIGLILCAIATRKSQLNAWSGQAGVNPMGPQPGYPAYGAGPAGYGGYGAAPQPGAAPASAAGWQADPSGKFQYRYWSGAAWTENVSTNGVTSTDPVPQTPPGPTPAYGAAPLSSASPTSSPLPPYTGPSATPSPPTEGS